MSQGVGVEVLSKDVTENDAGVSSNRRKTQVRVTHIQRLKVSGCREGGLGAH